jgi:NADH-quinone oxidoreductase subunit H
MFHFSVVTNWIDEFLRTYLNEGWTLLIEFVLIGLALLTAYAVLALLLIYIERKVCAFFQCRIGPNRVGPFGILQSVADMIKILLKEIIHINKVDPFLFRLACFW